MGLSWSDVWDFGKDPAHLFTDDPADVAAANTASAGARGVADMAGAYSREQWDRQMQGLSGALGAYGPSQQYWQSTYGNQGPGQMEQWWNQNKQGFTAQPLQQQAYNGYQDWMQNGVNATQQGANAANGYLAGPTASSQAWNQMGQGLQNYSGPQNGQNALNYGMADYQKAGQGENYYAQNKGKYDQETNSQASYEYLSRQLQNESDADSYFRNSRGKVSDQEMRDKANLMRHQSWAEGQTALQANEGENKGYARNANQLQDYYNSQQGALQGPGQYEQFVTADINGANPAFQRQRDEGIAKINQEMARRGTFNSGGAMTAIGNYTGALDAADYENRANRAKSAQEMQMSRIGQGLQGAGQVSALDVQRGAALGSLDTQSEQAQAARQSIGLQAEQNMLQAEQARNRLDLDSAKMSGDSQMARLMAQNQMAGQADANNLGLLNAGQNAASDAQSQMLQRLMGYQNSANQVDQTRQSSDAQSLARMMGSYQMAQGSDASNLGRASQLFNQGQGIDANMMSRYAQQGNMAQGIDQQTLAQLLGGGKLAGEAQSAEQQRMMQAMNSLFGINDAQAGQYGQFYGQAGQLSGEQMTDAFSALMQSYGYAVSGNESAKDRQAERQNGASKIIGGWLGGK